MDPTTQLQRTVDQAKRIVDGVRDDQLGGPTPCEEWDVRALLGHLVGGSEMFDAAVRQGSVPKEVLAEITAPGYIDADFRTKFATSADSIVAAFAEPGAKERMIELPFGTMPGAVVQNLITLDLVVHTADLAHATGQAFDDSELAEAAIALGRQSEASMGELFRAPNVFGPEQDAPADAPAPARLLAFAGRKVGA